MASLRPGMYIEVRTTTLATNRNDTGNTGPYLVPYSDKFGFTCTQNWFAPLKELYEYVKALANKAVGMATGDTGIPAFLGSVVRGGLSGAETGARLFGYQLFTEAFQAKAWEGSQPVSISITLNFFFGMNDKYSGKDEVYDPIMQIMSRTVPKKVITGGKGGLLYSPGPTGVSVFAEYTANIMGDISALFNNGLTAAVSAEDRRNEDLINTRKWYLKLGYSKDGTEIQKTIFSLSNLVVTSSSFNFDSEVDSHGFPIGGQVTLQFTSQTLIVESDFTGASPAASALTFDPIS